LLSGWTGCREGHSTNWARGDESTWNNGLESTDEKVNRPLSGAFGQVWDREHFPEVVIGPRTRGRDRG
jgi:hypothetical protein